VDTLILDLLDLEEARRPPMAMKDYSASYYKWLAGRQARAARQREDRLLAERIR
jgi:hypothetical protein